MSPQARQQPDICDKIRHRPRSFVQKIYLNHSETLLVTFAGGVDEEENFKTNSTTTTGFFSSVTWFSCQSIFVETVCVCVCEHTWSFSFLLPPFPASLSLSSSSILLVLHTSVRLPHSSTLSFAGWPRPPLTLRQSLLLSPLWLNYLFVSLLAIKLGTSWRLKPIGSGQTPAPTMSLQELRKGSPSGIAFPKWKSATFSMRRWKVIK